MVQLTHYISINVKVKRIHFESIIQKNKTPFIYKIHIKKDEYGLNNENFEKIV
jgi:hypothetical protein